MEKDTVSQDLLSLTTEIVSAHVSNNTVSPHDVSALIESVFRTLSNVTNGSAPAAAPAVVEKPQPAVSIKKSVTPDYIVCLEDGKKVKMLKRHLKTSYNLSP